MKKYQRMYLIFIRQYITNHGMLRILCEAAHENEPRLAVPSCHGRRWSAKHPID